MASFPLRSAPPEISRPVAAFFDLDGTLLPPPSLEWRFVRYLMSRAALRTPNILRWFLRALTAPAPAWDSRSVIAANKSYLAGLPESLATDWARSLNSFTGNASFPGIFSESLSRILWHQSQDHRVFLVSGTLAPLAACLARSLPGDVEFIATELETSMRGISLSNAIWTGELLGEHMVGIAKCRALQAVARTNHLDLRRCYAYGNSKPDCAMLETVGNPIAVNASRGLARIARERHWPSIRWHTAEKFHKTLDKVFINLPGKNIPRKEANAQQSCVDPK